MRYITANKNIHIHLKSGGTLGVSNKIKDVRLKKLATIILYCDNFIFK